MPRSSTSAPIASRSTRGPLHMIGNAHIDAVWLWPWQEGYQEARATYAAALDRIAEYPDFVFSSDSVAYFAWIEEHDPSLFERLREQVRAGRFEIVGGWWVEPDCNIPGGESFARHALYSQRYLCDRFGIPATIGCNVDPFGQNATMPQLLAKSGMDSYVFMRPQLQEKELPGPTFWWTAADGSRVLAYRIPHEYCSPGGHLGMYVGKVLAQLPHTKAPLMAFYGVGNHGGGPTRANIDSIHDLGARDQFPRMKLSTMREFFDDARHDSALPSYTGEIQPHAVGCYSAHSGIKAWLRHAENALQAAEKWASIAAVVSGIPSAHDEIEHAWKQVLLNQFHDTAAGTALSSAYGDAREQIGEAKAIAARVQNRALQSISCRIGVPAEDHTTPLVAFNVHPWPVRGVVEFEYGTALGTGPIVAEDDEGNISDVQVAPSVTVTGGRRRLLVGVDLPALGYRLYRLRPALGGGSLTMPGVGPDRPVVATEPVVLENAHLRAVVDPATGWLSSLSTSEGPELIPPGAARHAVVLEDLTDTWGHGVVSYRDVIGAFRPSSVRVIECGPVRTTVRVKSAYRSSTLTEDILLDHDARHLEVRVTLDWHEHLTMLKLRFPTALSEVTATHAIPYGHVIRPADGHEAPSQAWVDVSGVVGKSPAGLSVLDDAKCGVDVSGGDIGMTVVRSPAFAWHEPQPLPADGDFEVMDQGVQRFTYRLLPHSGDWRGAGTPRAAAELNQPLVPVIESAHGGPLGPRAQYAQVRGAQNVLLGVVKPASDGSRRTVVRGYETAGHSAHAVIDLPFLGRTIEIAVAPAEIFTLLVPHDLEQPVLVTDLLEGLTAPPAELPSPG